MADNKINLPKTQFSMKANLAGKEPMMQKEWEKQDIYNKILEKNKDNESFILHDGPPYANGHIHLGHALNKVLKDIIIKYESMSSKYAPYIPGWDCHGLPIEYQLLKDMETDKNNVDQLKFRQKAAKYALKHVKIQKEEFKRLGIFGDWENPYLTLLPEYEGNIVRVFKELVNKGYIYRGLKPVYWCADCETALAEAEVEYADHKSTSVVVKFEILSLNCHSQTFRSGNPGKMDPQIKDLRMTSSFNENTSVLIWTTTPWTLPSNVAVAFHPDLDYVVAEVKETENENLEVGEKLVLSKDLLPKISEKLGITKYVILKTMKGVELENIKVQSPYRDEPSVGILADYVTVEDGTGVVHIAPGHGVDDYIAGLKYNLPIIAPVNSKGCFTSEVEKFEGKFIMDANPLIVTDLNERKLLLQVQTIEHSYPHCWRCKSPVIFRATSQWFLKIDHDVLREKLMKVCDDVNWIPDYGYKRITSMIENRPDWCLSRQRLWGTPIPAFYCNDCGEILLTDESMSAIEKVFREKGSDVWFYRSSEELLPENIKCEKCGNRNFEKEKDILDVWFDSGVSHEAVLKERENLKWPADLYLEGSDQHRGWFQSSIIPAVALYGKPPYKSVLTHGFTVDGEGKKMSKSQGNVISPHEIINKFGADVLRLWISSQNYRDDMPISDEIIKQMIDAYRKIRNTVRYILGNLDGFDKAKDEVEYTEMLDIDKWALAKLADVSQKIIKAYEARQFHVVYREFYKFCTVELSSLYFDILKDRLYVYAPKSQERRSAQTVLWYLASFLTRFMAPIMPFTAEEIWANFESKTDDSESVLLTELACVNLEEKELVNLWLKDSKVIEKWNNIFEFRSVLLKRIEEKRLEGIFGNSLGAKLIISIDKEIGDIGLVKEASQLWKTVAIVSQVEINIGDIDETDLVESASLPEILKDIKISVKVEKANGEKCDRCWNYSQSVGKDIENPEYCDRCIEILKNFDTI